MKLKTIFLIFVIFSTLVYLKPTKQYIISETPRIPKEPISKIDFKEVDCLAKNLYYEANTEPIEGIIAVGIVTVNRAKAKGYPNSLCKVVYQKAQFSWTLHTELKPIPNSRFQELRKVAYDIVTNQVRIPESVREATHYHTFRVHPVWNKSMERLDRIGAHVFFKDSKIILTEN